MHEKDDKEFTVKYIYHNGTTVFYKTIKANDIDEARIKFWYFNGNTKILDVIPLKK